MCDADPPVYSRPENGESNQKQRDMLDERPGQIPVKKTSPSACPKRAPSAVPLFLSSLSVECLFY